MLYDGAMVTLVVLVCLFFVILFGVFVLGYIWGANVASYSLAKNDIEVAFMRDRVEAALGPNWRSDGVRQRVCELAISWRINAQKVWDEPTVNLIAAVEDAIREEGN